MASKENAVWLADKASYQIQYRTQDGSLKVRDTVPMVNRLATADSIAAMGGWAKSQRTLREAALSLQADILDFGGIALSVYKGQADPNKNLPAEFLSSYRDAEAGYFKQFLVEDHPQHAEFVKALPKINDRGERLEVGGKLNPERQFQYYLTAMRKAPSYNNAKNVVLGFWGYCGQSPISEDGNHLVPPEIMKIMVSQVRTVEPADNSFKGRLYALRRELIAEAKMPPDEDMAEIVSVLDELHAHAKVMLVAAKARLATRLKPGDVVKQYDEAMDKVAAGLLKPQEPTPALESKPFVMGAETTES